MIDNKSLVAQLGWRLAAVLFVATLAEFAWLFFHFRDAEQFYGRGSLRFALFDFFFDVAWALPVIGVVTFLVCAAGLRRLLASLKTISEQASRIEPGQKHTPLAVDAVPSEVRPLVASVNVGFDRLVSAVEVQRRFTANAAHELRTPVAVLQACLERLPDGSEVAALRQEVRRTGRIVQQLLSLARLEGNNGGGAHPLDVVDAIRDAVAPLVHLASAGGVTLAFDSEVEAYVVVVPQEAIDEIIRNLTENALSHAPTGSEVTIALSRGGTLTIADRGPGVPDAEREHIFERFWRGKWTVKPGSGLGLAIVSEACQRIGASIECAANPGGGAIFTIKLPESRVAA